MQKRVIDKVDRLWKNGELIAIKTYSHIENEEKDCLKGEMLDAPKFEELVYTEKQEEFMKLVLKKLKEEKLHLLFAGPAGTGKTYCMPKGTLIKTPNGIKPIEDVEEVLSYNFKKKKIEPKKAIIIPSGKKRVFYIYTKKGIMKCSPEHRWFVIRDNKRQIIETKDLKTSDYLLYIKC